MVGDFFFFGQVYCARVWLGIYGTIMRRPMGVF